MITRLLLHIIPIFGYEKHFVEEKHGTLFTNSAYLVYFDNLFIYIHEYIYLLRHHTRALESTTTNITKSFIFIKLLCATNTYITY